ncbi:MAG TPA: DUF6575 domain-containing protein [Chryseolinea sp.]
MKDLEYKVDAALLTHHKKVEDLLVYDGPVLSHFVNPAGDHFLYYWVDETEQYYQWLIFKIEISLLNNYLTGALSLREIMLHETIPFYHTADTRKSSGELVENVWENVRLINKGALSADDLPGDGSYYTFSLPKPYNGLGK